MINKTRSVLYKTARVLGDINAVLRGKITQRLERRVAGKVVGRLFNKLFRNKRR